MRLQLIVTVALLSGGGFVMGYESIYPQTPVDTIEIKQLPERLALTATAPGDAFDDRGTAFLKLFDYIKTNQVSMSVPVQASPSTNEMIFLVGAANASRAPVSDSGVTVHTLPAATVVSLGMQGRYTRSQYEEGLAKLQSWLAIPPDWQTNAPPYRVYWNAPFRLWFLRRAELHQPVTPADRAARTPAAATHAPAPILPAKTTTNAAVATDDPARFLSERNLEPEDVWKKPSIFDSNRDVILHGSLSFSIGYGCEPACWR